MLQISNTLKIAGVFFNEPIKPHYLIEISKKSKLAHTSVKRNLNELKKQGIIIETVEKKGKRKFPYFKSNIENKEYKKFKKIYNLIKLEESGIIDYIKDRLMPKSVIVFGSYSKGEDIEESDIDIFVETKKQEIQVSEYEKKLKRKVELHFKENFDDYPNELKNNIINGIVLYGYLEVYR